MGRFLQAANVALTLGLAKSSSICNRKPNRCTPRQERSQQPRDGQVISAGRLAAAVAPSGQDRQAGSGWRSPGMGLLAEHEVCTSSSQYWPGPAGQLPGPLHPATVQSLPPPSCSGVVPQPHPGTPNHGDETGRPEALRQSVAKPVQGEGGRQAGRQLGQRYQQSAAGVGIGRRAVRWVGLGWVGLDLVGLERVPRCRQCAW